MKVLGRSQEVRFQGFWNPPLIPRSFTVSIFKVTSLRYILITDQTAFGDLETLHPTLLKIMATPLKFYACGMWLK